MPPRLPDITPLDFLVELTLKEKIYKTPVNTKGELQWRVIQTLQIIVTIQTEIRVTTNGISTRMFTS